jgi:hypothetical protein
VGKASITACIPDEMNRRQTTSLSLNCKGFMVYTADIGNIQINIAAIIWRIERTIKGSCFESRYHRPGTGI